MVSCKSLSEALVHLFEELNFMNEYILFLEEEVAMLQTFAQNCCQRWSECDRERQLLEKRSAEQENELTSLRNEFEEEKAKLIEARSQLATIVQERQALLSQNCFLQSKVKSARSLMEQCTEIMSTNRFKLENLLDYSRNDDRQSLSSANGIDFDQTDDCGVMTSKTRHEKTQPLLKRMAVSAPDLRSLDFTSTFVSQDESESGRNLPPERSPKTEWPTRIHSERIGSKFRRVFQPKNAEALQRDVQHIGLARKRKLLFDCPRPTALDAKSTIIRSEVCNVCDSRISFGKTAMRCLNCLILCHKECTSNALSICVPKTRTPKKLTGKLVDYVPQTPPYIPQLLIHCLVEIERRSPLPLNLYESNEGEDEASKLVEKFLSCHSGPNLKTIENVNILTTCVKIFLEQLAEPLIPRTSTSQFMKSYWEKSANHETQGLREAFEELPMPNRDTLAFLLSHLRRLVQTSTNCRKTKAALAGAFGPILFRSSLTGQNGCDERIMEKKAMDILLSVPQGFWRRYLWQ